MNFLLVYFSTALLGQVNFHILIAWVYYTVHFAVQLFHQLFKTPYLFRVQTSKMYGVIKIFKQRLKLQKFWRQRWLTFYSTKSLPCMQPNTFSISFQDVENAFQLGFFSKPCFLFFCNLGTASQVGLISFLKCKLKANSFQIQTVSDWNGNNFPLLLNFPLQL